MEYAIERIHFKFTEEAIALPRRTAISNEYLLANFPNGRVNLFVNNSRQQGGTQESLLVF